MPISRPEFEKERAEDSTERMVVKFLDEHPDKAFTAEEISTAIGHSAAPPPAGASELTTLTSSFRQWSFDEELKSMARQGLFELRNVRTGETQLRFYASKRMR